MFHWVGLAEITSLAGSDSNSEITVHLRTIVPLQGFVPRGWHEWEGAAMAAFQKADRPGAWAGLSEAEAKLLYQYAAEASEVHLPEWFPVPASKLVEIENKTHVFDPTNLTDGRTRVLQGVVQRRGQREFRRKLFDAYNGRCAISGCAIEEILEAAHIVPYFGPETNHSQNGLLLRADLHTLFDLDLIWIDPDSLSVQISPKLTDPDYLKFQGHGLSLPKKKELRPSVLALRQRRSLVP